VTWLLNIIDIINGKIPSNTVISIVLKELADRAEDGKNMSDSKPTWLWTF